MVKRKVMQGNIVVAVEHWRSIRRAKQWWMFLPGQVQRQICLLPQMARISADYFGAQFFSYVFMQHIFRGQEHRIRVQLFYLSAAFNSIPLYARNGLCKETCVYIYFHFAAAV